MGGGHVALPLPHRSRSPLDAGVLIPGLFIQLTACRTGAKCRKRRKATAKQHGKPATMNRYENPRIPSEARVRYLDGDYQVETPGTFVRCAVTGSAIPLDELKYWSVEHQEAYVDAKASMKRYLETR